ncbi:MAG TPA: hypothetical protein VI248_27890 [Kineosporiaceae bacterium]
MLAAVSVNAVVARWFLRRAVAQVRVGRRPPPRLAYLARMTRVGVPTAGMVLIKFGTLGVLAYTGARRGPVVAAAHSIGESMVRLTFTAAVAPGLLAILVVLTAPHGLWGLITRGRFELFLVGYRVRGHVRPDG